MIDASISVLTLLFLPLVICYNSVGFFNYLQQIISPKRKMTNLSNLTKMHCQAVEEAAVEYFQL